MFSRLRSWVHRHRRKFIVTGVIVGGSVLLYRYVQQAYREWQDRETKELLERTRKQQHFESVERTCNQHALTLAPNLKDTIIKLLKTEELIEQLRMGADDKLAIWEKLKILAFTKISALVYASSLLMVTLRIQLNLIGGYMFQLTTEDAKELQLSSGLQEKYLRLCEYFIEDGAKNLCSLIEEKVELIIKNRSLKEKLTLHDIEQIFWVIQSSVANDERDPCKNLRNYILPEQCRVDSVENQSTFEKIIIETNDLLESDEIISLTGSCINRGFSYVMDQVADYFQNKEVQNVNNNEQGDGNPTPGSSKMPDMIPALDEKNFTNLTKVSIPMAKMIPIVNGLVQNHSSKNDVPHSWMQQLILMDSLKTMGANIYETFSSKG